MTRIVVSGVGVLSAVGLNGPDFWNALVSARSSFAEASTAPGSRIVVAEIGDAAIFGTLGVNQAACDRSALLAIAAAREALADARLDTPFERPERVAVILGNGGGGIMSIHEQYSRLYGSTGRPHPSTVAKVMGSSSASWVSMTTGARGPCFVTSSACASGAHAIGVALQLLRSGAADVAITGGTEAPLSFGCLKSWESMKIMSPTCCRPFSRGRNGLVLGEGAGMLVLETEEHAARRGATGAIELAGFGSNADAGSMVAPSPDGMAGAMRLALADARLAEGEVAYVNAHGTGTTANDASEVLALKSVFGESCPPVSSTKGATGHTLGAAGGIEAVATVLAMRRGVMPPTANFDGPDPACDIDCLPNEARTAPIPAALSNSFAFGGLNATLAFRAIS